MSDLLIILVALGVLIVLGVLLFNWQQERKYKDRVSESFKETQRDVLIEDFQINADLLKAGKDAPVEKVEPSLSEDAFVTTKTSAPSQSDNAQSNTAYDQPAVQSTSMETPDTSELSLADEEPTQAQDTNSFNDTITLDVSSFEVEEPAITTEPVTEVTDAEEANITLPEAVHLQTDLIGVLYATEPLNADQVSALNDFNAVTHHFAFGQTADHKWLPIDDSTAAFNKLLYAMQMADRGGPATREVIHAFQQKIESIGSVLGAQVEWQNKGDPVSESVALDNFCIEVDKTIGFHLVINNNQFHGTKFKGLVEAQGLQLRNDGRYVMTNASNQEEFYVKNYEGKPFSNDMLKTALMSGVTFQLDLPTVANSSEVYDTMINCAKAIASSLNAEIVDDKRKAIGDIQFEKIREQLNVINAQMIAKGIIPGSVHALRLFS